MPFQCTIVTPEQQCFDQPAEQVIVPAHDGLVGILSNRAPLLLRIGAGPLQIDLSAGPTTYYYVEGGVAQMKDNRLTVLTHVAVPKSEINLADAQAELAAAENMPAETQDARDKKASALRRARGKLQVAEK